MDKITDLALNKVLVPTYFKINCYILKKIPGYSTQIFQMKIGNIILQKKRVAIMEEIENYSRVLFQCILHDVYEGPKECMKQWWIDQGWTYPWDYPSCD